MNAPAGRGDVQQAAGRHQLADDRFAACVMAEHEKQQDGGGKRHCERGEQPARQWRGNDDRTQPLATRGIDDFLSEQPCDKTTSPLIRCCFLQCSTARRTRTALFRVYGSPACVHRKFSQSARIAKSCARQCKTSNARNPLCRRRLRQAVDRSCPIEHLLDQQELSFGRHGREAVNQRR